MGVSGWKYFVPYQSNITKALNELREQVFQSGKFYKRQPFWQDLDDDEYADEEDEDLRAQLSDWLRTMKALKEPTTIDELLVWNEEDGTHSILDYTEISSIPEIGKIAPLSPQQLLNLFDTEKPTHNMVKQKVDTIMQLRETWQATYIIIYQADLPNQIFFTGYSGD